jgi:enoyl-CoA hydratase/carnithine racemase
MFSLRVDAGVAGVTLDRPPVNAINDAWVAAFHRLLDGLGRREDWTVLRIRSSQKVFSAGADLKTMREKFAAPDGTARLVADTRAYQELFARIEALPQVSVAEIGGAAVGGGFELALACDLRIAARHARIGLPEVRLGLRPGAGGTQRLTRLCGPGVAARLILGAELLDGAAAAALGLVQWAVPADELAAAADDIAARVAALPAHSLAQAKACIARASTLDEAGFAAEVAASAALLESPRTRELVAAFLAGTLK